MNWFLSILSNYYPFVLLLFIALPLLIIALIRPDNRFYCHIKDCNEAFDTMEELIEHLQLMHDYKFEDLQLKKE